MGTELSTEDTLSSQTEQMETEASILDRLVYVELVAGGLLTLYGIYYYLENESIGLLVTGGIVLFLAVSHYMKTDEIAENKTKVESGRSGEQFVSKLFREDLPDDVYILNDIDVEGGSNVAQNDHILVHTSGIYLIETKTYGGTLEGHAEDEEWTQIKENNGSTERRRVTNPIQQNEYHRAVFERFLEGERIDIDPQDIHCYVAMVVKQAEWNIDGDDHSVDYAWYLVRTIEDQLDRDRIEPEQLHDLLEALPVESTANVSFR